MMTQTATTRLDVAKIQLKAALFLLMALVCILLSVDAVVRISNYRFELRRRAKWKKANAQYQLKNGFVDFEDRLLLDEIPNADYSRGGVIFSGSSNVKVSLMTWELPPEYKGLISNYGTSSANFYEQFQFIRYLIDYENLLEAGPEKTTIVLGLFHGMAKKNFHRRTFFPRLFRRYGLYAYSHQNGIQPVPMNSFTKRWKIERIRYSLFVKRCHKNLKRLWFNYIIRKFKKKKPKRYEDLELLWTRSPNLKAYTKKMKQVMGTNWERNMDEQLGYLSEMIEYLQDKHVNVEAVFLPIGSWHYKMPYFQRFYEGVTYICDSHGVPVTDLTRLLDDRDFNDCNHPTYKGQLKLHDALMKIAISALIKTGVIDPEKSGAM